jgi:hypothetical protein
MRRIFWGFCRNWFLIDPLDYLSSRSAFGFVFAEIFEIEKRLRDSASRGVDDSPTWRVGDDSPTRRVGESPWWGYSKYFKFIIDFPVFKRVNQAFKIQIWQKGRQGCYVLLPLTDLKVWKKLYPKAFLSTPRLGESGSRFSITNISANTKPKAERLER